MCISVQRCVRICARIFLVAHPFLVQRIPIPVNRRKSIRSIPGTLRDTTCGWLFQFRHLHLRLLLARISINSLNNKLFGLLRAPSILALATPGAVAAGRSKGDSDSEPSVRGFGPRSLRARTLVAQGGSEEGGLPAWFATRCTTHAAACLPVGPLRLEGEGFARADERPGRWGR